VWANNGLFYMLGLRAGHIQIRLAHSKTIRIKFLSAKLALIPFFLARPSASVAIFIRELRS
jgi:hypothetical protein